MDLDGQQLDLGQGASARRQELRQRAPADGQLAEVQGLQSGQLDRASQHAVDPLVGFVEVEPQHGQTGRVAEQGRQAGHHALFIVDEGVRQQEIGAEIQRIDRDQREFGQGLKEACIPRPFSRQPACNHPDVLQSQLGQSQMSQ